MQKDKKVLIIILGILILIATVYFSQVPTYEPKMQKYGNYEFFPNELNSAEYTYINNSLGIEFNYPKYLEIRGPNDVGHVNVLFFSKYGSSEAILFDVTLNSSLEAQIEHIKKDHSVSGQVGIEEVSIANKKGYRITYTTYIDPSGSKYQYVSYMVMNSNIIYSLTYQLDSKEDILLSNNLPVVQKVIDSVKFSSEPPAL